MIKKQMFWIATCNKCGKYYGEAQTECFDSRKELVENIEENSYLTGWIIRNKKLYCEDCQ